MVRMGTADESGGVEMIELEVDILHRGRALAILSDGQEVPITNWFDAGGDETEDGNAAASCVCGPDFDGRWYAVDLSQFTGAIIQ